MPADTGQSGPLVALAVALGLGLLVGLQREWSRSRIAGVRTFALVTLFGAVCAMLAREFSGWVLAAGLLAVALTTSTTNMLLARLPERAPDDHREPGATTEAAMLLMFAIGALLVIADLTVGVALGAAVAVLLQLKSRLHGWAARLGEKDMRAIMTFAALTFIVLPVVPDHTLGPLDVLNPHHIWLMVVLVVGISLAGYLIYKFAGEAAGTVISGLLGGMISSTATTAGFSRRAASVDRSDPAGERLIRVCMLVIIIAGSVVYARVLAEIAVVSPAFLAHAALPLLVMLAVSVAICLWLWIAIRRSDGNTGAQLPEPDNPTELKSALYFAAAYALVLLGVAYAQRSLGNSGVYIVAAISGLTDMDAITLSTAKLVNHNRLDPAHAWRAIIIAAISNMLFKAGIVFALGGSRLGTALAPFFAIQIAAAVAILLLWP